MKKNELGFGHVVKLASGDICCVLAKGDKKVFYSRDCLMRGQGGGMIALDSYNDDLECIGFDKEYYSIVAIADLSYQNTAINSVLNRKTIDWVPFENEFVRKTKEEIEQLKERITELENKIK